MIIYQYSMYSYIFGQYIIFPLCLLGELSKGRHSHHQLWKWSDHCFIINTLCRTYPTGNNIEKGPFNMAFRTKGSNFFRQNSWRVLRSSTSTAGEGSLPQNNPGSWRHEKLNARYSPGVRALVLVQVLITTTIKAYYIGYLWLTTSVIDRRRIRHHRKCRHL